MYSKSLNKLYLFYPTSLLGFLICLVTRSPFAHAAVMFNGVLYDASESRGDFGRSSIDPTKRKHLCIEFSGDLAPWLASMTGRKYDYGGVLLWVLGRGHAERVYCFEAAWHALRAVKVATGGQPSRLSGSDLLALFVRSGSAPPWLSVYNAEQILQHFGGSDRAEFISLLWSDNGGAVGMRVMAMARGATGKDHPVDVGLELAGNREALMSFEEVLYDNADGLRCIASRDSPAPA